MNHLKIFPLIVIFFILLSASTFSQPITSSNESSTSKFSLESFIQRLRPYVDLGIRIVPVTDSTSNEQSRFGKIDGGLVSTLGLGAYIPFVQLENLYALGLQTGISVGGTPYAEQRNIRATSYVIDIPVFLAGKVGSGSSKLSPNTQGIGVGLGAVWVRKNAEGLGGNLNYRTGAWVPAAFLEASVNLKKVTRKFPINQFAVRLTAHLAEGNTIGPATPQGKNYKINPANFGYYGLVVTLGL